MRKRVLYTIKIRKMKDRNEEWTVTEIDDKICQTSLRTDTKNEVLRFLKEELVI
jgi:hypothetical protein